MFQIYHYQIRIQFLRKTSCCAASSETKTIRRSREVGMMHSLFTTTMGELLLLLTVSLGCELTTYILPLAEDQTGETRREQEKTLES
ncbi:hypothetical protein BDE02_09G067500 [Populus trichocarpa]|nr:hypothetical protein BDE02_09G067500 [Populus trichocarpa]